MKIYFGVNGIGRGHAMRSFRLAERLSKMGYEVYMSSYGDGYKTLQKLNSSAQCCHIIKLDGYMAISKGRKARQIARVYFFKRWKAKEGIDKGYLSRLLRGLLIIGIKKSGCIVTTKISMLPSGMGNAGLVELTFDSELI